MSLICGESLTGFFVIGNRAKIVRCGNDLVPIEVKAGNNQSKSLKALIGNEKYRDVRWGVKIVNGNVGFANGTMTVPQWCAFLLPRYLGQLRIESRR